MDLIPVFENRGVFNTLGKYCIFSISPAFVLFPVILSRIFFKKTEHCDTILTLKQKKNTIYIIVNLIRIYKLSEV